jgi:hypothetical protein
MSLLDRIRYCQRRDPSRFRRFLVGGAPVGWVGHALAERLRGFPDTFVVDDATVRLDAAIDSFDRRSGAVADVLALLRAEGGFPGWRDELLAVATSFGAPPLLQIERGAARAFGIRCYCVQLNGMVERDGEPLVWVARRALTKPVGPGKLDQIVGGAIPIGAGPRESLLKECAEEASIPAALARQARPVGAVAYLMQDCDICDDEVLFNYDLMLPAEFMPVNADGEVASFELWPFERLQAVLSDTDDFLFDVALSLIDLLVRRGLVGPSHPHYIQIAEGLWSAPPKIEGVGS